MEKVITSFSSRAYAGIVSGLEKSEKLRNINSAIYLSLSFMVILLVTTLMIGIILAYDPSVEYIYLNILIVATLISAFLFLNSFSKKSKIISEFEDFKNYINNYSKIELEFDKYMLKLSLKMESNLSEIKLKLDDSIKFKLDDDFITIIHSPTNLIIPKAILDEKEYLYLYDLLVEIRN